MGAEDKIVILNFIYLFFNVASYKHEQHICYKENGVAYNDSDRLPTPHICGFCKVTENAHFLKKTKKGRI